jgi:MFS family permease
VATHAAPRPELFTRDFVALLVANAGFGYAFSSFFLLPKFMALALSAGPREVGWVTAAHGAVVVLALPPLGSAADRLGRRGFLIGGALLMAVASLGYAQVHEVGALLYGIRMVQGLAFAMAFAAGGALAVDLAPPSRLGQAIGIYGLTFLSMNAIAPACVELLASRAGWELAFSSAAAGALLCAMLSQRIREPQPAAGAVATGAGLFAVAARASTLRIIAVIALVGCALSAVFQFHQLYAIELGMGRVSGFFAAYALTAVTLRTGFGHLMDQWGLRRVALGALVVYAGVVLSVAWLGVIGLVPIGVGMGIAHGTFYPSFNAVAVSTARVGERAMLMAIFQAAFQVGMGGGGLALGFLAARAGYPAVFETAAAAVGVALCVLWLSPEGRGTARASESGRASPSTR